MKSKSIKYSNKTVEELNRETLKIVYKEKLFYIS